MTARSGLLVWSSDNWQAGVLEWVDARLDEHGIRRTGIDPSPRIRPWAALLRIPTDHGDVWFKAASPMTAHEMALYPVLTSVVPDLVLKPLAVDPGRAWLLLPHGGESLMHAVPPGDRWIARWAEILPLYARLQIDLMPHLDTMLGLGVPDMRPEHMAARFDEAFDLIRDLVQRFPEPGDDTLLDRIGSFRTQYAALCEQLAGSPIPPSLDHGDLHANNVLPSVRGAPAIYDWGDSTVAHPFATMLEFRRFAANALGTPIDDGVFERLTDAYLAGFENYGRSEALQATVDAACRVAMVSRALTYAKLLDLGPLPEPAWNREAIRWMERLLAS